MDFKQLLKDLIFQGYLKSPDIINAFEQIERKDFLPDDLRDMETLNEPLPIGHNQTISQPLTVAFMLELLKPRAGMKILDVGSGSGWTTAILAQIVGESGKVYAVERIPELVDYGRSNVRKYNFNNVEFFCGDGSKGLKQYAPFDRILVSAAAFKVPQHLKEQLNSGGRLVIPTAAQDIRLIEKNEKNEYQETIYPGFVFVPLIEE